jgi:hypothetical protein
MRYLAIVPTIALMAMVLALTPSLAAPPVKATSVMTYGFAAAAVEGGASTSLEVTGSGDFSFTQNGPFVDENCNSTAPSTSSTTVNDTAQWVVGNGLQSATLSDNGAEFSSEHMNGCGENAAGGFGSFKATWSAAGGPIVSSSQETSTVDGCRVKTKTKITERAMMVDISLAGSVLASGVPGYIRVTEVTAMKTC